MAWSLSAEDCAQLQKHFLALDQEKSGTISLQQFKSALESDFVLESDQEAEFIFRCLDIDGSTRIEYSEFLAAVMPEATKLREDVLRRTFARFDRNGDGQVCREELLHMLGDSCTASEIEDLLQDADTSGDGNLTFEEFVAYVPRRLLTCCLETLSPSEPFEDFFYV